MKPDSVLSNMPMPPWDAAMPVLSENIAVYGGIVLSLITIVFVIKESKRRSDLVPVYVLIGSIVTCFYEPLADWLVLANWPENHQYTYMVAVGHKMPLMNFIAYIYYFAPFAILILRLTERGFDRSKWWKLVIAVFASAVIMDLIYVHAGLVIYYGPQPLRILDDPIWAPAAYSAALIGTGVSVYGLVKYFDRKMHWLVLPAVPLLISGITGAVALPATVALYSTQNYVILTLCGLLSILLSTLLMWVLGELMCQHETKFNYANLQARAL